MKDIMNMKWRASAENMRKLSSCNGSSSADSWRSQDSGSYMSKEVSTRPPIYNAEDYAISLKKWTGKAVQKNGDPLDVSVVPAPTLGESEMSLRQFLSVSDLLNKLKTDLRLAYLSFVQEFVADPIDGVTLLLELLKSIQQKDPQKQGKVAPTTHRRTLLEENSCLQCLQYCMRCEETSRRLAVSSAGLYTLAVCIMSSVSKSRIISLELLSKVCCYSTTSGHNAVSEAVSTMRLRFGEPVRFRFLVSMLNGASSDLLLAGVRFINTFFETSPDQQTQLYIQAELEQAGFNSETFKKILSSKDRQDDSLADEFNRWSKHYIDVDALKTNYANKCKEVGSLKERLTQLEAQIRMLQNDKNTLSTHENGYDDGYTDLEYHISVSRNNSINKDRDGASKCEGGGNSTPAEDEGISSSDQDDSEEIVNTNREFTTFYSANDMSVLHNYNGGGSAYQAADKHSAAAEPTIDEVMEDFQNIINDVQNQNYRNEQKSREQYGENDLVRRFRDADIGSSDESLNATARTLHAEADIVPARILPEPPKKTKSLHLLHKNIETNPFFEDDSVNYERISPCNFEPSPPDRYFTCEYAYEKSLADAGRIARPTLRRSETFHHLQSEPVVAKHNGLSQNYVLDATRLQAAKTRRSPLTNDHKVKMLNAKNKSYAVPPHSNNFVHRPEQLIRSVDEHANKLARSASAKPKMNGPIPPPPVKCAPFPRINPVTYFSKKNVFPGNANPQQFSLKRHQNAGLYSDTHHAPTGGNAHLHQVITITSEYPKRSLNGLKHINLNICEGKLMDLPSGLY